MNIYLVLMYLVVARRVSYFLSVYCIGIFFRKTNQREYHLETQIPENVD